MKRFTAGEKNPDILTAYLQEIDGVSGEDVWMDSSDADLKAVRIEEDVEMDRLLDEETSENPIILTSGGRKMLLNEKILEDAIALTPFDSETAEDKLAERMAEVYSGSDKILDD